MPAGLDAPGRSCLVRYWLLRQVRTYNLYVELLRRVTAVAGSALGGLGLGAPRAGWHGGMPQPEPRPARFACGPRTCNSAHQACARGAAVVTSWNNSSDSAGVARHGPPGPCLAARGDPARPAGRPRSRGRCRRKRTGTRGRAASWRAAAILGKTSRRGSRAAAGTGSTGARHFRPPGSRNAGEPRHYLPGDRHDLARAVHTGLRS